MSQSQLTFNPNKRFETSQVSLFWAETRKALSNTDLENFKMDNVIRGIPLWQTRMKPFHVHMLEEIKDLGWYDFTENILGFRYVEDYEENTFEFQGSRTTSNRIRNLHHVHKMPDPSRFEAIFEFGAGIGEFASIFLSRFRSRPYYIYDLPEVLRLSQFYLKEFSGVEFITEGESWSKAPEDSLLVSMWGLSEIPTGFRDHLIRTMKPKEIYLTMQSQFEDINNLQWAYNVPGYKVEMERICDHDWDEGSWYVYMEKDNG